MNKCFEITLEGRVQGVGYRNFALTRAIRHDIKGYVRNTPEGNLEILCSGTEDDLEIFINEIKKGPSFAFISKIKIDRYTGQTDFKDFKIIY